MFKVASIATLVETVLSHMKDRSKDLVAAKLTDAYIRQNFDRCTENDLVRTYSEIRKLL